MRIKHNQRTPIGARLSKATLLLVLTVVVVIPLGRMLVGMQGADFTAVLTGHHFVPALVNSLVYTLAATAISVVIAYLLAICTERVDIKCKRLWGLVLTLPMLIPSISHANGLVLLFGPNGMITNLLGLSGSTYIIGAPGIIAASVMYAFPVVYIMLADVLRYEDMAVYEAAEVLGIGRMRAFGRISLPYMKKTLITAAFSAFAMIVTDYGVPLSIGGQEKTLASLMYESALGLESDLGQGAVYGLFLLVPAVLAFTVDLLSKERVSSAFVTKNERGSRLWIHRLAAYAYCTVITVLSLLPILAFVRVAFVENYPNKMNLTWDNFDYILGSKGEFLVNSLVIALLAAVLGTAIGFFSAYLTARMKSPLSKALHLLSILSMAVPGMVLGISYLMTFKGSFMMGTFAILIMVNTAHFLSSPYLMMYNSFGKKNENLEAVGSTLGIGRARMLGRVFLPQSFGTLAEMFSYLFVNCMMTISAVAFLANADTRPISLLIKILEKDAKPGRIAVVSLVILLSNIMVKLLVEGVKALAARRRKLH